MSSTSCSHQPESFVQGKLSAIDGGGLALGWGHLLDQMVKFGTLLRPQGDTHLRTKFGCDLLTPQKQPAFPSRAEVDDWLMGISAARTRYGA